MAGTGTEEYFPRGGKKPIVSHFKQSSNFLGAPEKSDKKKKRPKKKSEADDGYLSDEAVQEVDQSVKNCAIGLSYKTLKPGLLILGRVRRVHETKLLVMLPSKMTGTVMACHISEAYNKMLQAYVNDEAEKVLELSLMFRPGQYVGIKVLDMDDRHPMLSLMPQHVNGGKMHADLHVGCLLQSAVTSVEDHGYVMDIGIPNTTAFLPKKYNNPEVQLDAGMLTWCVIKSLSPSPASCIVELSTHLDALQAGVMRKSSGCLLPGTAVDFTVDQPLENGIEGHIFKDTTAYVQRPHVDRVNGKKPALGQRVRARILYVMPTRNTPFLTMKNIFETTYPDLAAEQKYQEGDIVENAQVIKITDRTIQFKLSKGSVGAMSLKKIAVDEDLTDEDIIARSYPIGSARKVRVLAYNLCDYMYSVTDQPGVVNEKYFSLQQLAVGELLRGAVKEFVNAGVIVTVGRLSGLVPHAHLSDAGVAIDPNKASVSKLPKKKYKVGQEITARVLFVDPKKNSLVLTTKPTLLAPDLEILSSYEQAEIGKAYTGVIKYIRDYVLVMFFNNVMAFVPRNYVTKDPDAVLFEAFHIGQIVHCTILRVDPESKKMTGSLTTPAFWPAKKRESAQKRKLESQDNDGAPHKKQRTDSELSETTLKKKKDKKKKAQEDVEQIETEDKKSRKKKEKKISTSESEDISGTKRLKKEKKKKTKLNEEEQVIESVKETKKKKLKRIKVSDDESGIDNTKHEETDTEHSKKRKRKKDNKVVVSEESDAIETDIYEDSDQILTPQEQGLIDFSDCQTEKQYRKRIVSLLKAIKARTYRFDKIIKKIQAIEEKGLDAKTKKFHTAMHMDKLTVEERTKKLLDALNIAQTKYKEFNVVRDTSYKKKKVKKVSEQETEPKDEKEVKLNKARKLKEIKVVETLEPALEVPSAKDFWSANPDNLVKNVQEESSSSDDEEQDQPKKKRKKLTVAEKVAKARGEEERVRDMERRAIESESQPRSSEQFERALLANPDCSQLWIAYMAFHLQATEIEKARTVGRKALNVINFREEQERLNVWLAMLNCEHRFGNKESQQKTLEEALQMNDTFKVHSKLLDILVETSKQQELSSLVDLMMRKYKQNPENYILCGDACFKLGMVDKARHVMQKAISVLVKKEHVSILVQFALMERSSGSPERAEALFEQVLAIYPQRVDVCSVYADMLVKSGDADRVRQVMERMTSQSLPARKMKVLYKKWIEVEEKLGDQVVVEKIRHRAMEFIDKAKF